MVWGVSTDLSVFLHKKVKVNKILFDAGRQHIKE